MSVKSLQIMEKLSQWTSSHSTFQTIKDFGLTTGEIPPQDDSLGWKTKCTGELVARLLMYVIIITL